MVQHGGFGFGHQNRMLWKDWQVAEFVQRVSGRGTAGAKAWRQERGTHIKEMAVFMGRTSM